MDYSSLFYTNSTQTPTSEAQPGDADDSDERPGVGGLSQGNIANDRNPVSAMMMGHMSSFDHVNDDQVPWSHDGECGGTSDSVHGSWRQGAAVAPLGFEELGEGNSVDASVAHRDFWYTAPSDSSIGSAESLASSASRQRTKRRRRKQPLAHQSQSQAERRRYQCTFCTDTFKTKHDWQRHESTLHLNLEEWHCARFGPFAMDPGGTIHCVFCELSHPATDHSHLHNYPACLAKPQSERIFLRKDHLMQHLRRVHNCDRFNAYMETWLSTIDTVNSRCGFCDERMTTWAEREKHLAHHFRKGADMKDWKGDRGFDEAIDSIVRDDMPAFMIGQQRNTVEPFSASQADHCVGAGPGSVAGPDSGGMDTGNSPHSYRNVERLLLAYVAKEIREGRVPSDKQLQKKTGEIIYGPGHDEWDQTWADNTQWLEQFRKKAGLISLPLTGGKNAFVGHDEQRD